MSFPAIWRRGHAVRSIRTLFLRPPSSSPRSPRLPPVLLALIVTAMAARPPEAGAQVAAVDTTLWITDGTVGAVVRLGDRIYLAGAFFRVGPPTGGAAVFDPEDDQPIEPFSRVAGVVRAVVPDGSGGWFVGGDFTWVRGVARSRVAHVRSDGSLGSWAPDANARVYALARTGSTVYLGGEFTSIDGQPRSFVAAVDAQTGELTPWSPTGYGGGSSVPGVHALLLDDGLVYVGGRFINMGGVARDNLAALDPATGLATSWNPGVNGAINALASTASDVYAGGGFTFIGGAARNCVAALDKATGVATPWNPFASASVRALVVGSDPIVGPIYMGGDFTFVGGASRRRIAAVDAATGNATAWNPSAGPSQSSYVSALALNGGTVFAGGDFDSLGNEPRSNLAALDAVTGAATSWDPSPFRPVAVVQFQDGRLFAGGDFTSVGGVRRRCLAALDATTGRATSWGPDANGSVGLLVAGDGVLYAGGLFDSVGAIPRNGLVAVDTSGTVTPWDPGFQVRALAMGEDCVYAGGYFTAVGGEPRNHIAAIDAGSGEPTAWDPCADSWVESLAVSGGTVYAGGDFLTIGGQTRHRLAALDAVTGQATDWDPDASYWVQTIVPAGGIVYVGGYFSVVGGQPRERIAALDAVTGTATPWDPQASYGGSPSVHAIAVSGGVVYAAGYFDAIGGEQRHSIAALDATSGHATSWDAQPTGWVTDLAQSGETLYASGWFTSICRQPQSYMGALSNETPVSITSSLDDRASDSRLWFDGPNPTRSESVRLRFELAGPDRQHVSIQVFDVTGRLVKSLVDGERATGAHGITWDRDAECGHRVGAGVYFVRFRAGSLTDVRKAVLVH